MRLTYQSIHHNAAVSLVGNVRDECVVCVSANQLQASELLDIILTSYRIHRTKKFYWAAREHLLRQVVLIADRYGKNAFGSEYKSAISIVFFSQYRWWCAVSAGMSVYRINSKHLERISNAPAKPDEYGFHKGLRTKESYRYFMVSDSLLHVLNEKRFAALTVDATALDEAVVAQLIQTASLRRKEAYAAVYIRP